MRVIDAVWERRNLGMRAVEVTLEPGDSVDSLRSLCADFVDAYIVVKVPSFLVDALWWLPSCGFIFIETIFHCHHKGINFELNPVQLRLFKLAVVKNLGRGEIEPVLDEVRQGVFATDRIALDPRFGVRVSNERYANWIEDECGNGGYLSIVEVKGDPIGFYALKQSSDGGARLFLSGLFRQYKNSGLGFCTHFLGIQQGIRQGAKRVHLAVSSNNRSAAALYFQNGHYLDAVYHVFVNAPKISVVS
jgi:hypothetical protein